MKTISIELRVDENDADAGPVLEEAAKEAARILLTQAMLVTRRRKPQIAVFIGDNFTASEEIVISEDT